MQLQRHYYVAKLVHMVYWPRQSHELKIDVVMLPRKIIRDSVYGISESQLAPGSKHMAYECLNNSNWRHPVCMILLVVFQKRANRPFQSSSTERRHKADLGDYLR